VGTIAFIALATLAVVLFLKAVADPPALRLENIVAAVRRWIAGPPERRPYLRALAVFALLAAPIWVVLIILTGAAVLRLFAELPEVDAEALRWHTLGIATMILALAGLIGAPLALIRVWTTERQTHTAEQGHVTDLINKAVEGLAAEKTVSRIGRPVAFRPEDAPADAPPTATEIEWQGTPPPAREGLAAFPGDWQSFESTEPNIEVRLGAIYALERISQDSDRDHIRVMEILCAYIRENAPARDAPDHGLGDWPDYPDGMTEAEREERKEALLDRSTALRAWLNTLPHFRTDLQAAITVIGRRRLDRIALERTPMNRNGVSDFHLDLRRTNLQGANLIGLDLRRADLSFSRLEGAVLRKAGMERANLTEARMEVADLWKARAEGAKLWRARMEGAVLWGARMERAFCSSARMEGVDLRAARMEGANLSAARLEGANLRWVRMEGALLRVADLKSVEWADAQVASPAHSADFRGARGLTQDQLDTVIGDVGTLLPHDPPLRVWTCWTDPPANLDALLQRAEPFDEARRDALRAAWVCSPDNPRRPTGTPCPPDLPREECRAWAIAQGLVEPEEAAPADRR
jgi:uncharacterized protein YjbI with pentapeptide repeats